MLEQRQPSPSQSLADTAHIKNTAAAAAKAAQKPKPQKHKPEKEKEKKMLQRKTR
jgi:hypothetical protein